MYVSSIIGDSIKDYCAEHGISQAELARKADVSEATISKLVRGENTTLNTAAMVAKAMRCTLTELLEKGERRHDG